MPSAAELAGPRARAEQRAMSGSPSAGQVSESARALRVAVEGTEHLASLAVNALAVKLTFWLSTVYLRAFLTLLSGFVKF